MSGPGVSGPSLVLFACSLYELSLSPRQLGGGHARHKDLASHLDLTTCGAPPHLSGPSRPPFSLRGLALAVNQRKRRTPEPVSWPISQVRKQEDKFGEGGISRTSSSSQEPIQHEVRPWLETLGN